MAFDLLAAIAIRLRSPILPFALFATALLGRAFTNNAFIGFFGSPIAVEFLFGIAVAKAPRVPLMGLTCVALGVVWLLAFPNSDLENLRLAQSYGPAAMRVVLWGVPAALIVYGCLANEHRFKSAVAEVLSTLGIASYSIYLIHLVIEAHILAPIAAK